MTTILDTGEYIIGDHNASHHHRPVVNGVQVRGGCKPRDWKRHPHCFSSRSAPYQDLNIPLISRSEWSQRIKDLEDAKARISDMRMTGNAGQMVPSLDQNGKGYCWAHSSTSATTALRYVMGEPYVGLSAYAIACIIKSYQDEGGWGAESMDFVCDRGVPSYQLWPEQSMSRSNDKPETWANAALHKVTAGWIDMQKEQYDRVLTFDQVVTCLLSGIPVVTDFNWWSHSVMGADAVDGASQMGKTRHDSGKLVSLQDFERIWGLNNIVTGGYGIRIWNSWGDSWSQKGMGVLTSDKAVPDGSVAPRVTRASAA